MGRPAWFPDAIWTAVLLALLIFVVTSAAGRALDPIIDTGRDLYIPEQVRTNGIKLYRDILYYYPPLTVYALAAITSVTGSSLAAYTGIGAAIALLTMAALYVAGRVAGGATTGGAAALLFAAGCVYSVSGRANNYLFPYAHAATMGMLFFMAGGAFLLHYAYRGRKPIAMALAVTCLLAASWTKIEFILFSAVLFFAVVVAHHVSLRWVAAYGGGAALSFVLVDRYFADAPSERHWLFENVLAPPLLSGAPARHFYRQVAGFNAPIENLGPVLIGAVVIGAAAMLLRWVDRRDNRALVVAVAVVVGALALVAGGAFFRVWALIQFLLIPFALRRPRDPLLIIVIMSLCGSSRVLLRLFPSWYGFVFIVPTLLLMAYVLFDWLPDAGLYSRRIALVWLVAVAVIAGQFLWMQRRLLEPKRFPIETARGTFFDFHPNRAAILNEFLAELERSKPRTLVVAPEGLALNYLSRVPTPIAFHTFTPVETADPEIEHRIVRELESRKPELIAVVPRPVREFGYREFGKDYNRDVDALIRREYAPVRDWRRPGFSLLLLHRREP